MEKIEFRNFEKRKRANFVNSLSGFKSANLIATKSREGVTNLAIFSSAVHIGADPALVALVFRPDSVPRDTLSNIRETKVATLNHVHKNIYKQAHQTSARYKEGESEFEKTGLTEEYKDNFAVPFVGESRLKYSLELKKEINLEINNTHFLIFEIMDVYLEPENILDQGQINLEACGSITVSSLNGYHETHLLERLSYAKP